MSIRLIAAALAALTVTPAMAQNYGYGSGKTYGGYGSGTVRVDPYVTSNGTYVQGHVRSAPDGTAYNNWSSKGNVNPYTGKSGTKSPYGW